MSTQHFEPGPVEFAQQLDEKVTHTRDLVTELIKRAKTDQLIRPVMVSAGAQLDATGFGKFLLYEVPAGMGLYVDQINLEAINAATGLSYTPAAPFTAGWVGIFRGEPGFGALVAFNP